MDNQTAIQAYPLSWPVTVPRTAAGRREDARFHATKSEYRPGHNGGQGWTSKTKRNRTLAECVTELHLQMGRMGATKMIISTNIALRLDGLPRSGQARPQDPGAAVYFELRRVPYCLPCDKWTIVEDNLWAIAKHLDAMRGMERWGVGSVEQQFMGYKALSATAGEGEDPWMVLGLAPMSPEAAVLASHRKLAIEAHPDRGGSSDQMSRVNVARDMALAALKAVTK